MTAQGSGAHFDGRPRVLIPITMNFSIRYVVRTGLLERMLAWAKPVLVMTWEDEALAVELRALGAETAYLPPPSFSPEYRDVVRRLDLWFRSQRLRSPSTAIDSRRARSGFPRWLRAKCRLRDLVYASLVRLPGMRTKLEKAEAALLHSDTNIDAYVRLLDEIQPDVLFSITPFVQQEFLLLKAAAQRKLRMCTSILSFDNVTTRPQFPCIFDKYLVWNTYNRQELERSYGQERRPLDVAIVGPAQFDFYANPTFVLEEQAWRRSLGVPSERPVILYLAGPPEIAPHESLFVEQLDDAIDRGLLPREPILVVRRHPMDSSGRWAGALTRLHHTWFDDPWGSTPEGRRVHNTDMSDSDIGRLVSSLAHSQVHVSVSSTTSLDGSFFDRPQVCPAYDDRPGRQYDKICRDLYRREHYLPVTESGAIEVCRSRSELIAAVERGLRDPGERAAERKAMLQDLCTFTDGKCTERLAKELQSFVEDSRGASIGRAAHGVR